jgi:outer membrane protein assembly factor BamA
MRRLIAAILMASMALMAQAPAKKRATRTKAAAPAKTGGPAIETLQFEGASRLSEAELTRLSGIKRGDAPTKEVFEAAKDRLLATGCVETVSWRYGPSAAGTGYAAVIAITEADQFIPWSIDRLPLTEGEFAAAASEEIPCFGKDIPTYERYLNRATALVQKLLNAKGVKEEATAKVGLVDGKTIAVVFQPKTPPPNIYDVQFTGNKAVPGPDLRKPLAQAAIGMPYNENLFRQLLDNQTKPIYETIGRLTVKFPSVKVVPAAQPEVKGVLVIVEVDEGPVYTMEEVKVEGAPMEEAEIEKLAQFERGKTVNYTNLGLAMERVLGELRNRGYLRAAYKALRSIDEEKKTTTMTIQVDPGGQFTMGRLIIVGLDVITEPAIRKLWIMEAGKPYRKDYPEFFLNQVRTRGVLDFLGETKADEKVDEAARRVDVTLTFKGGVQNLDSRQPDARRPGQ